MKYGMKIMMNTETHTHSLLLHFVKCLHDSHWNSEGDVKLFEWPLEISPKLGRAYYLAKLKRKEDPDDGWLIKKNISLLNDDNLRDLPDHDLEASLC